MQEVSPTPLSRTLAQIYLNGVVSLRTDSRRAPRGALLLSLASRDHYPCRLGELFGKPLYRQVLDLPLSQNQTQRFSVPNSSTFEVISKLEGTIRITAPHGWLPLTFYNNQYVFCFFNIGSNLLEVKSDWGGNRAIIIIEYTKTTDNVVSL